MRFRVCRNILFSFFSFLFISLSGCELQPSERISVVASTTQIGTVLKEVGGDNIDLKVILPGGMCPGHFDLKPSDMAAFSSADAVFYQGWEPWINKLVEEADEELRRFTVLADENLMVPSGQAEAAREVKGILQEIDPQNSSSYDEKAGSYIEKIEKMERAVYEYSGDIRGLRVVASEHQKGFLSWLGVEVAGTYKRADDMSPGDWERIIEIARDKEAVAVIDNLQSGSSDGKIISGELGIEHAVISNFPLNDSYVMTVEDNIEEIREALLYETD